MANDETIFREVDQELAEDRLWTDIRRRGPFLLGLAFLVVAAVAVTQVMRAQKASVENEAARAYNDVLTTINETPEDAEAALELFLDDAPDGYAALARFRLASGLARDGETTRALELYRAIYGNGDLPRRFRDLARLRAAHISVDQGRDAVLTDIGDLENADTPLARYAREILAIAALDAGDYEYARTTFRTLMTDPASPPALKARAEEFAALASQGRAGIDIAWPENAGRTTVDDLVNALGASAGGLSDLINAGAAEGTDDLIGDALNDALNDGLEDGLDDGLDANPDQPVDDAADGDAAPEDGADTDDVADGDIAGADETTEGVE